jgi:hypothetical protein
MAWTRLHAEVSDVEFQCHPLSFTNIRIGLPAFANGAAIHVEWERGKAYFIGRWRKKPRKYRPDEVADPPLLAVPGVQAVVPQIPAPAAPLQLAAPPPRAAPSRRATPPQPTPPQPTPPQPTPPQPAQPQAPDSPETLAGGSLPYVGYDEEVPLHPSRNQRTYVRDHMQDQDWKFVRVLYQTKPRKRELHPNKNVLLYVRPDDDGQITEVSEGQ